MQINHKIILWKGEDSNDLVNNFMQWQSVAYLSIV